MKNKTLPNKNLLRAEKFMDTIYTKEERKYWDHYLGVNPNPEQILKFLKSVHSKIGINK